MRVAALKIMAYASAFTMACLAATPTPYQPGLLLAFVVLVGCLLGLSDAQGER
jgi:hypothetical protein